MIVPWLNLGTTIGFVVDLLICMVDLDRSPEVDEYVNKSGSR